MRTLKSLGAVPSLCAALLFATPALAQRDGGQPDSLYSREHYDKAEYMVPMRDGVKLYTIVYTPKDTSQAVPIMLLRTPYGIPPYPLTEYKRVLGVDEPRRLVHENDGKKSPLLPEGMPFGLVGTSSLYKRESYPRGLVPKGGVTATGDPYGAFSHSMSSPPNWGGQGADAGLY